MKKTPFLHWWKTTNDILRSRGLPEMFFGEAWAWYAEHRAAQCWSEVLS